MQEKYSAVVSDIETASSEKASLQSQLATIQDKISAEQKAAKEQAEKVAKEKEVAAQAEKEENQRQTDLATAKAEVKQEKKVESTKPVSKTESKPVSKPVSKPASKPASESKPDKVSGKEMYVQSTAYTASCAGCSGKTATGIDLKANPHLKVIAVDPSVIPLGSKVYVEGYGVAVAGDTGGAIKGYKIDVFVPSKSAAMSWGRRTVKVTVLN